jgi:hypothetical protein
MKEIAEMRDTQKQLAALTEEQRQELLERILLQRTKPKRFALSFAQQRLDPWQPKAQKWAISISNLQAKPK